MPLKSDILNDNFTRSLVIGTSTRGTVFNKDVVIVVNLAVEIVGKFVVLVLEIDTLEVVLTVVKIEVVACAVGNAVVMVVVDAPNVEIVDGVKSS